MRVVFVGSSRIYNFKPSISKTRNSVIVLILQIPYLGVLQFPNDNLIWQNGEGSVGVAFTMGTVHLVERAMMNPRLVNGAALHNELETTS
jgi:hypothetical protein